jgi:hypothetical protein
MTDFDQTWAPTWEVQKTIRGALSCLVENTGRAFKTGRPIVEAVFYDGSRRELCRRQGMTLTSKKGVDYTMCRRDPADPPATQADFVGDEFDDL